jgi:hypothetical protein
VASNSVIVKADGSVVTDNSTGPKIIVGKVIESKADIRRRKTSSFSSKYILAIRNSYENFKFQHEF